MGDLIKQVLKAFDINVSPKLVDQIDVGTKLLGVVGGLFGGAAASDELMDDDSHSKKAKKFRNKKNNLHMKHNNDNNAVQTGLVFVIIASIVGAIVAYLIAPEEVKNVKNQLSDKANRLKLEAEARAEQGVDKLKEWKTSAEEMVEDAAKKVNETIEDTLDKA